MTDNSKHILVAALDWGLGHATRCIPVINLLIKQGHRVSIAGCGPSLGLLKNEFPELEVHTLTPYNVTYSKNSSLAMTMLWQLPRLLKVVKQEHHELEELIAKYKIQFVISDNRYGCWSHNVPSVLITHQLNLIFPSWLSLAGKWVNKNLQKKINRFDACWVPDFPDRTLTGSLSEHSNSKVRFIGMLSRFKQVQGVEVIPGRIVCLISGPEPQRQVFEDMMKKELEKLNQEIILVRGLPASNKKTTSNNVTLIDHLDSEELNKLVQSADIVICRSGYSTIMDLQALAKKKVIVIPTPGQTEQEYLASKLEEQRIAVVQSQKSINMTQALADVKTRSGFETIPSQANLLAEAIDLLLKA